MRLFGWNAPEVAVLRSILYFVIESIGSSRSEQAVTLPRAACHHLLPTLGLMESQQCQVGGSGRGRVCVCLGTLTVISRTKWSLKDMLPRPDLYLIHWGGRGGRGGGGTDVCKNDLETWMLLSTTFHWISLRHEEPTAASLMWAHLKVLQKMEARWLIIMGWTLDEASETHWPWKKRVSGVQVFVFQWSI